MRSMPPLHRYRMLDLSRQLPGPFCSTVLADLGMDVLVVSAPNDPFQMGIPFLARNKRHMTLNLKAPEGRELFLRLADEVDVVLEGFRPGVMQRLGLDYETLRARNPRLVYCAISGYGQDGPYRDKVGHDVNYLGYAGVLEYCGPPEGPPMIPGVQVADVGAGSLMAAIGIMAALTAREETGRGQLVDVAMQSGAAAWNVAHQVLHWYRDELPQRGREQLTGAFPCYAVYECRDGKYVTVGAFEGHFWATLCRHLGREDFIADQWAEGARRDEIFAALRAAFREKTRDEWVAELGAQDICFGPVLDLAEAYDDPQLQARGMVVETDTPSGPKRYIGPPIKLSETPAAVRTPPAAFGEHTDAVLRGLGLSADAIARLRDAGVV
jgi:crotonobetainyl-CoA:carnitine CoA-transferase CaiB-like acyl-CoA transferase